jgi:hypothetical protein
VLHAVSTGQLPADSSDKMDSQESCFALAFARHLRQTLMDEFPKVPVGLKK